MHNAQQRGALCAHGELRNCLYHVAIPCPQAAHHLGAAKRCLRGNSAQTVGAASPWGKSYIESIDFRRAARRKIAAGGLQFDCETLMTAFPSRF